MTLNITPGTIKLQLELFWVQTYSAFQESKLSIHFARASLADLQISIQRAKPIGAALKVAPSSNLRLSSQSLKKRSCCVT